MVQGTLALCTVAAFLVVWIPRVSVTPGDPVLHGDPFSASFTIKASNIFPLYHVRALIASIDIVAEPLSFDENSRGQITNVDHLSCITEKDWNHHTLSGDEKYSITPYSLYVPSNQFAVLAGADIAIVVDYQPWFIPIRRRQVFRFVTHHFPNGEYRWFSYPLR